MTDPQRAREPRFGAAGVLGCLLLFALVLLIIVLVAWWTEWGIFAPDGSLTEPKR